MSKPGPERMLAIIIPFLFIFGVLCTTGIYFETNDDRYITEILAGVIAVKPDAHTVYVNYLLALPLSWLYGLTNQVPWYGGCLILLQMAAMGFLLDSACSRCIKRIQALGAMALIMAIMLSGCYMTGKIQYTSTAAFLAGAGYVCLLLHRRTKTGLLYFTVLELSALLLRDSAMLMMQPLGLAALAGSLMEQRSPAWKEKGRYVLLVLLICGSIVFAGLIGRRAGYLGEGWREYALFNQYETELFDYYGVPVYEEVQDILKRHQVTKAQYDAYRNYTILDWDVSIECEKELAEYASAHRAAVPDLKKLVLSMIGGFQGWKHWGINKVTLGAWGLCLLWIFIRRRFKLLLPAGCIAAAHMLVWGYLIWKGRMPARVTIPLYVGETFLLAALLLKDSFEIEKIWQKRVLWALMFCFCLFCLKPAREQYHYIKEDNAAQELMIKGFQEIQDYCREHPENKYLIESNTISYYRGSALETEIYQPRNSVVTGSWYANSPVMRKKLAEYLKDRKNGLCLIVYDGEDIGQEAAVEYLAEAMDTEPVLADRFKVSHGGAYKVYHFSESGK